MGVEEHIKKPEVSSVSACFARIRNPLPLSFSLSLSPSLTLVHTLFKSITLRHIMYEGDGTQPLVEDALRWLERESI